jgi:sugar lactone lactonase YvrE
MPRFSDPPDDRGVVYSHLETCETHLRGLTAPESPFWDAETSCIWLVDMFDPALVRTDPQTGETEIWKMPEDIGSFALCEGGGAIVALRSGVYLFDLATGTLTLFATPEPDRAGNRLNDGKASPEGRFWVGSMNLSDPRRPDAALYRIDPDGHCTRMIDGLYTSNGLAWSADGRRMFHSDSRGQLLQVFDYDPVEGSLSNNHIIARLSETDGRPDGGTVDSQGYYWSAGASAGCLNRFSATGDLVEKINLPVSSPSMICFGGKSMDRIFVTSLARGAEDGRLISFPAKIAGLHGHRFRLAPIEDREDLLLRRLAERKA